MVRDSNIGDERIIELLKLRNLSHLSSSIENKKLITDSVSKLSGGEIKRLALALSLVRIGDLIILDEFTNGLDKKIEHEVIKSLKHILEDKIVLIISHQDSVIAYCDEVLTIGR